MNGLSWLIYLSDISGSLSGFATFICVLFFIGLVVAFICTIGFACGWGELKPSDKQIEENDAYCKKAKRYVVIFLCFAIIAGTIAGALPSKKTVLLIAASEIGQRVMTSEKMQSVVDPSIELVQSWLKSQTMDLQAEIKKQTEANKQEIENEVKEAVKQKIKEKVEKELNAN